MDYKDFHNQVITIQNKVKDSLDDKSHSHSREITAIFQKLEDDVQVKKNINSIREQLKLIEATLLSIDEKAMSSRDVDYLIDWVSSSLQKIR